MLSLLKNINLLLALLLELGVVAALGYWGFYTGQGMPVKIVLGIGAPLVAIIIWAIFGAPRSARRLKGVAFLVLRIVFFGSAVVALFLAAQPVLGAVVALLTALNLTLLYIWKQ